MLWLLSQNRFGTKPQRWSFAAQESTNLTPNVTVPLLAKH